MTLRVISCCPYFPSKISFLIEGIKFIYWVFSDSKEWNELLGSACGVHWWDCVEAYTL